MLQLCDTLLHQAQRRYQRKRYSFGEGCRYSRSAGGGALDYELHRGGYRVLVTDREAASSVEGTTIMERGVLEGNIVEGYQLHAPPIVACPRSIINVTVDVALYGVQVFAGYTGEHDVHKAGAVRGLFQRPHFPKD